jgi:hypothetical protein
MRIMSVNADLPDITQNLSCLKALVVLRFCFEKNKGQCRQPDRFLGHIQGSPSIKYKSHYFTKYRVIGKQKERETAR